MGSNSIEIYLFDRYVDQIYVLYRQIYYQMRYGFGWNRIFVHINPI